MENSTFVVLLLAFAAVLAYIKWNKHKEPLRSFFAWLNKGKDSSQSQGFNE